MIDIHTHVLPRLDDGAKDVETAVSMLEREVEQGVRTVVFTPHYYSRKCPTAQFLAEREEALARLKGYIPTGLTVRLGAEVHFTGVNDADYEELAELKIEGTRHILLEFPFTTVWDGSLFSALADFIDETGLIPIVAHVERYVEVFKDPSVVNRLVDMGCLIQVNAAAFADKWVSKLALPLLRHGLVHCVGTDAHDTDKRKPNYASAAEAIKKARLFPKFERVQSNMQMILDGGQVCVERAKPVKKRFGKFR